LSILPQTTTTSRAVNPLVQKRLTMTPVRAAVGAPRIASHSLKPLRHCSGERALVEWRGSNAASSRRYTDPFERRPLAAISANSGGNRKQSGHEMLQRPRGVETGCLRRRPCHGAARPNKVGTSPHDLPSRPPAVDFVVFDRAITGKVIYSCDWQNRCFCKQSLLGRKSRGLACPHPLQGDIEQL